jgi:hemerythrin-like domain-containing protein
MPTKPPMNTSPFPGFDSPAAGFDQPFELLMACHDRVRRSLALLGRIITHVKIHGHDAQSRSAAADVLRYFDIAAPLHHEDEELHVFAALADCGDPAVVQAVRDLQDDHLAMATRWTEARAILLTWRDHPAPSPLDAATHAVLDTFRHGYDAHIATEENLVYPAARARLDADRLARIGAEMQARRRG